MNGSYFSPNGRAKLKKTTHALEVSSKPVASLRAFAWRAADSLFHLGCTLFTFWRERSAVARAAGEEALETINIGLVYGSVLDEKTTVASET